MTSYAQRKGTEAETRAAKAGTARLAPLAKVFRPRQAGFKDTGDLHGIPGHIIQVKARKDIVNAIREGLAGAQEQKVNANVRYGVALVHRARLNVLDWYLVYRYGDWLDFVHEHLELLEENQRLRAEVETLTRLLRKGD